ncbi:3-deoxy-D-manno-octulosonic acid transferase [Antarctobacter jejuensis]|uniref:3-deoxy-D-manno-octulosonic acid transferase n=1 Tax=Antarctobacter jejuensis TaxID=1439938 RepID=UPI003FD2B279
MLLYRLLISLFSAATLLRALREGGVAGARARVSLGQPPRQTPHIWLHGASNGELASVRPVLEPLIAARPDLHWLITANTKTGLRLADSWDLPRTTVRLAPLDLRRPTRRVMQEWQVRAHIVLESELWPNRLLSCPGPVLLLGARMSTGSARMWSRLPRLARRLLSRIRYASAQDPGSARRLTELGLSASALGPVIDLKALYQPPAAMADASLDSALPRGTTWLAASTHEGDEEIALEAHALLLTSDPDQRLILAPRHPRRADVIAAEAVRRNLTVARRGLGEAPETAQVYLADTMGEMPLWYARAGRVFIGGTLSDRGGHTPYEPAAFGAALLHGPDTRNFSTAFDRLRKAGASFEIRDAQSLAQALQALNAPAEQAAKGDAAAAALRQDGNLDGLLSDLLQALTDP